MTPEYLMQLATGKPGQTPSPEKASRFGWVGRWLRGRQSLVSQMMTLMGKHVESLAARIETLERQMEELRQEKSDVSGDLQFVLLELAMGGCTCGAALRTVESLRQHRMKRDAERAS